MHLMGISSAHIHAPASHRISLVKHKLKDKVTKNFRMAAVLSQAQDPSEHWALDASPCPMHHYSDFYSKSFSQPLASPLPMMVPGISESATFHIRLVQRRNLFCLRTIPGT